MIYLLLANLVLLSHVLFVVLVVVLVPLIILGRFRRWSWVRLRWLRIGHIAGVCYVAIQSWFGWVCPLTTLEMWLRNRGGLNSYSGGFIEHWLQRLLYWNLPDWVFVLVYSLFALLVVSTWFVVPPRAHHP